MCKVLVTEQTLYYRYHVAHVQRIVNPSRRQLNFSVSQRYNRKEGILNYWRTSPIKLLHKFPYPFVNNKVVFFLPNIVSKIVFVVEHARIVDTSELFDINVLEKSSIKFRPFFFDEINHCRFCQILLNELRFHCLPECQDEIPLRKILLANLINFFADIQLFIFD